MSYFVCISLIVVSHYDISVLFALFYSMLCQRKHYSNQYEYQTKRCTSVRYEYFDVDMVIDWAVISFKCLVHIVEQYTCKDSIPYLHARSTVPHLGSVVLGRNPLLLAAVYVLSYLCWVRQQLFLQFITIQSVLMSEYITYTTTALVKILS